jgi:hypothetical protein
MTPEGVSLLVHFKKRRNMAWPKASVVLWASDLIKPLDLCFRSRAACLVASNNYSEIDLIAFHGVRNGRCDDSVRSEGVEI